MLFRSVLPLKSNSLRAFILAMDRLCRLSRSLECLPVRQPEVLVRRADRLQTIGLHAHRGANAVDRQNFAKYLTIAKLKLENAIAVVRSGEPKEPV